MNSRFIITIFAVFVVLFSVVVAAPPNNLSVYHTADQVIAGRFPENYSINGTLNVTPSTTNGTNFFITSGGLVGINTSAPGNVFHVKSNDIDFFIGGGRLGIGTIVPETSLHVNATSGTVAKFLGNSGNTNIRVSAPTTSASSLELVGGDALGNGWAIARVASTYDLDFRNGGGAGGNTLYILKSNSYIGIGGSSPYRQLQVNSTGGGSFETNESAYLAVSSGSVGIGTTNATSLLQLGGASPILTINNTASGGAFYRFAVGSLTPSDLAIQMNGTTRMYVAPDGKVGIGTTIPNEKLSINGTVTVINSTTGTSGRIYHNGTHLILQG
ncbi:MAG: hypothetical protein HY364_02420 [Candidatus Aenigmarchaeota archaeon]|nr:hypothetical protein [Candidatus Aenigmarchaeota archaeon]